MNSLELPPLSRRKALAGLAFGSVATAAAISASAATAGTPTKAKTFVLVPGGWCGGWLYRDVAELLRAKGHVVHTPSLTGVGDRSHLLNASVNLDTHVADIVNLLKWEELSEVVLVGHSFSGPVLSCVAEKSLAALAAVVYVNAYVPENGHSITDMFSERARNGVMSRVAKGEISDPPPPAAFFMVDQKLWARLDAKHTPHPLGAYTQKPVLTGAVLKVPKKTYVLGTRFGRGRDYDKLFYAKFKDDPGWRTVELDSGHLPMVEMPENFVKMLEEAS